MIALAIIVSALVWVALRARRHVREARLRGDFRTWTPLWEGFKAGGIVVAVFLALALLSGLLMLAGAR